MDLRKSDFEKVEEIGQGAFGQCSKIRRKRDGKIMVWKQISVPKEKDLDDLGPIMDEMRILDKMDHPNIVKYYGWFQEEDKFRSSIYILMEYCEGGDLGGLISSVKKSRMTFTEGFIWGILVQILEALIQCHGTTVNSKIILHRDLKPGNVFLTRELDVKLGDFGCSRIMDLARLATTMAGTVYYMAPEVISGEEYDEKCDIWSLGCLIYEMCTLKLLFDAKSIHEIRKLQKSPSIKIGHYSTELENMIGSMLQVKPEARPSAHDLFRRIARMQWNQSLERNASGSLTSCFGGSSARRASLSTEMSVGRNLPTPQTKDSVPNYYYGMDTNDDDDAFLCPLHGEEWETHGTCSLCAYISSNPQVRSSAMRYREKIKDNSGGQMTRHTNNKHEPTGPSHRQSRKSVSSHPVPYLAPLLCTDRMYAMWLPDDARARFVAEKRPEMVDDSRFIALCPDHGRGWNSIPNQNCTWCERNRYVISHFVCMS